MQKNSPIFLCLLQQKRQNYNKHSEEEKVAFILSCLLQLFESQTFR